MSNIITELEEIGLKHSDWGNSYIGNGFAGDTKILVFHFNPEADFYIYFKEDVERICKKHNASGMLPRGSFGQRNNTLIIKVNQ